VNAAQAAIRNPLIEDVSIEGARGVLINVTGGPDMTLHEVNEAASLVREEAHEDANIIFGSVIDESMGDSMRVTVIATGLTDPDRIRRERPEMSTDNVTPLRPPLREEASPETLMNATLPAEMEPGVRPAGVREEEFMSPFNDELDVPAFIRRKNSQNEVV